MTKRSMWSGLIGITLVAAATVGAGAAGAKEEPVPGLSAAEVNRLGEAMYQRGILPSGEPMIGVAQGDLEVTGTMTTCANCHMRSGLGSAEGGILTPPATGVKLYAPLSGQEDIPGSNMNRSMFLGPPRPAYTDATLARALRHGVDPTGRAFRPTMPRYLLDDRSMEILIAYMKKLSSSHSPGVTEKEVRFATIVADGVSRRDWEAMYQPLEAFITREWNGRLPALSSQWNARFGAGKQPVQRYRPATLDVWRLTGKPESWGAQLDELYRKKPVFAIVGGMAPGAWEPVHRFCEENRIPCILPLTDLPVVSDSDLYTLYFSKGYYQEGEGAAKYLTRVFELPPGKEVVQVYRESDAGLALARGFREGWKALGSSPLTEERLPSGTRTGATFWKELGKKHPNAVLLLWLAPEDLGGVQEVAAAGALPPTLFLSNTLLAGSYGALPDALRDHSFLTYPVRLPGDGEYTRELVTSWMAMKKIPATNVEVSAKAYLFTRLLANALVDLGADLYRDFLMDILDCTTDQGKSSLNYPQLTFGPGQRYASKGCYIVRLGKGEHPKLLRQSEWVIY